MELYEGLGQKLEVFDYKKRVQEKIFYAADLKAYLKLEMEAGDMQAIELLVKINCLVKLGDSYNKIITSGAMFCEP